MFEVENTLKERLELTKQQKLTIKNELAVVENKLRSLFEHLPTRPRYSKQQLLELIESLEYKHTTTPQTNTDERLFMREMEKLRKKIKEEEEFNLKQQTIDEFKNRKNLLLHELREKEINIDELYQGIRKLRVSNRLGCEPNALIECVISVPEDKLAHVIGRGGIAVKNIEQDCCVGIDVERTGGSHLRIIGLPGGVGIAQDKIQHILNTITEIRILPEPLLICLIKDKGALIQQIQDRYHVRIDISKPTCECKITGLTNDVLSSLQDIQSIDSVSEVMKLEQSILPFLMGKGGAIIRAIQNEHDIYLDVDREKLLITLIGLKSNVKQAKNALSEMINENKEIEDIITCERFALLEVIIGTKGTIIRQLQQEYGVGIVLEKEKPNQKPTTETKLEHEKVVIRGITSKVLIAKQHILELIHDYNSNTEYLSVPDYCIPFIVGKKGGNIQKLRSQYPDVTVDLIPNLSSARIHSTNHVNRTIIKQLLQEIINNNSQYDYQLNRHLAITLKSDKSLQLRNYLVNDLQIKFEIDVDNEVIKFRGHKENFPLAVTALDKFCDDNFSLENIYSDEDFASFLHSNANSNNNNNSNNSNSNSNSNKSNKEVLNNENETLVKKIENDYSVSLFLNKKQNVVRITGVKISVLAADDAIHRILHGDSATGESVLIPMNSLVIGALIGKGGKNIQEFSRKYHVIIDVLRSREQVRLRGTSDAVNAATKGLLQLIDKRIVSTTFIIDKNDNNDEHSDEEGNEKKGDENDGNHTAAASSTIATAVANATVDANGQGNSSHSREKLMELARNSIKYYGTDITVQPDNKGFHMNGTKKQIDYTKRYILDQLCGVSEVEIPILQHHYDLFQNSTDCMEKLNQTSRNLNVEITIGLRKLQFVEDRYVVHEHAIFVKGPNHILTKAKINVYRLLDCLFPAEFISIPMDNYILRSLWSDSIIAWVLSKQYPGASVTYDMIMSCLRIVGIDSIVVRQVMDHILFLLKSYTSLEVNEEILPLIATQKNLIITQITKNNSVTLQFPTPLKLSFYLKAFDENTVLEARQKLFELIDRITRENWQIIVNVDMVGTLLGKQGATIKKLREETKANIEFNMTTRVVKVTGKEQNVLTAKNLILQMIADKEAENYQLKLTITRECIPVIIGLKGTKIREIKQISGVLSLDIDRKTEQFLILKGRAECCAKAEEEIKKALSEAEIDPSVISHVVAKKASAIEEKNEAPVVAPSGPRFPPGLPPDVALRLQMSKTALKKLKRKEREAEQQQHQQQQHQHDDDDHGSDRETHVESVTNGSIHPIPTPSPPLIPSHISETAVRQVDSPHTIPFHSPSPVPTPSPPPPPVTPTFIPPSGTAGELLAILMTESHPNGNGHSISSSSSSSSSTATASAIMSGKSTNSRHSNPNENQPPPTSYFKSKSGFSIRL